MGSHIFIIIVFIWDFAVFTVVSTYIFVVPSWLFIGSFTFIKLNPLNDWFYVAGNNDDIDILDICELIYDLVNVVLLST